MKEKHIILKNVRVSFPHLFEKPIINGEEGKYGATLMLENGKDDGQIQTVEKAINTLIQEKWKGKVRIPSDKRCMRDGEDKGRAEYDGYTVISANSGKAITVLDVQANKVTDPAKSQIYAGCYVNAKIGLWAQDNKYGKRINAELLAIQFVADGESLNEAYVSEEEAMSGFEPVAGTAEDEDFLS